jgi:CheY-like chemotaxis protein
MSTLNGKKILIIDDMKDIRAVARLILENEGAVVYEAESVDQGIELLGQKMAHLIITDLQMPKKDGFDFLQRRKTNQKLLEIPTIVLSGLKDRVSVTDAIALGAVDYLLKPIRSVLLVQKVRKHLKSRSFSIFHFDKEMYPAELSLSVDIMKINESGLQIESPIKLATEETVSLSGEILTQLGCENVMTRTAISAGEYSGQKRYLNDINFIGIDEMVAKSIRKKIQGWK